MTTFVQTASERDTRPAREPLTMSASYGRGGALASYELTGEARVEGGVRSESAFHRFLDRSVTIVRLAQAGTARAHRHYTFVQSTHAQATLRHPSVAQVLDAGIHDDLPYAVVERPRGTPLDEHLSWLAEQGLRVDVREAIRTVDALAELLDHAHARGVRVHNLEPANVVLADDGLPVVLQIGGSESPESLRESAVRPAFSAPELLSGGASDHRSDIYALGALLLYTLTGQTSPEAALLGGLAGEVDAALLEVVIRRAMARRLSDRYTSARALRRDLAALLDEPAPVAELDADEPALEREVGGLAGWVEPAPRRRPLDAAPPSAPALSAGQEDLPLQNPLDVPGASRDEVRAALPYTVLVPLAAAAAAPALGAAHAAPSRLSSAALTWLSVLLVVATALGAALMLG
jgi:serine/threonine-protein kinase